MSKKTISETVSEKNRGRPPVMDKEALEMVAFVAPDVKTHRGKLNIFYRQRAVFVLVYDPRFSWIVDEKKMLAGTGEWKQGILSELGRIENKEDMKLMALEICKLKPKTKAAVAIIRRWRTGKESTGSIDKTIVRAINSYIERYPETPWTEVEDALLATLDTVRTLS